MWEAIRSPGMERSSNNTISGNTITDQKYGIYIGSGADNKIIMNIITNNEKVGVRLSLSTSNNIIYHNKFINNTVGVFDRETTSLNVWDDDYLSGGNYWNNYNGTDNDNDGIGDTPYLIHGGMSLDNHPLMVMYGPPVANFTYSVDGTTVSFNASSSYDSYGTIVSYEWDWDNDSVYEDSGETVTHRWSSSGDYLVTLRVTDNDGDTESYTVMITVEKEEGIPGFELVFLFGAILVALVLLSKRRKTLL